MGEMWVVILGDLWSGFSVIGPFDSKDEALTYADAKSLTATSSRWAMQVVAPKPTECRCAEVKVGGKPTGSYNWNPDCPVHPWNDELQAQSDRAVEWQRRAKEARKNHG